MRKHCLALVPALLTLLFGLIPSVMAADPGAGGGKSPAQLACERSCHELHSGWVDLCLSYHDPREIEPSARGQCVDAGSERLQECLKGCR